MFGGPTELHSDPTGEIDLEKELKCHEDWMRRGRKLFGQANAPLVRLVVMRVSPRERAAKDVSQPMPEDVPLINKVFRIFFRAVFLSMVT